MLPKPVSIYSTSSHEIKYVPIGNSTLKPFDVISALPDIKTPNSPNTIKQIKIGETYAWLLIKLPIVQNSKTTILAQAIKLLKMYNH